MGSDIRLLFTCLARASISLCAAHSQQCGSFSLRRCSSSWPAVTRLWPIHRRSSTEGQARFTILSSRLIRLEWSPTKTFVDSKTWLVQSRQIQPSPAAFNTTRNDTYLRIDTSFVTIEYLRNATTTFSQRNIRVKIRVKPATGETVTWSAIPGEEYDGNLLGTLRTLDGNRDSKLELDCRKQPRNDLHCSYGVISRRGYALVDDTHQPQFDNDPQWPWIVNQRYDAPAPSLCQAVPVSERRSCGTSSNTTQHECELRGCCFEAPSACFYSSQAQQDLYLFGHGRAYSQALSEFTGLSGAIPLPPRYIFGVFFSRYWAYAEYDERQIVAEYIQHDIPLDVLVVDMDWHKTFYKLAENDTRDQAGQTIGWSGYTFDEHLFPNAPKFLQWCKQLGLKNTLNLHPASGKTTSCRPVDRLMPLSDLGIQPWEEMYKAMAQALGIDPSTGHYVPFNVTDKKYSSALSNIVLDPLQQAGIDLWWLDWQQGEDGWMNDIPYTNPTFWLNHVFFTDPHFGNNRPALLHRWGGLGNHRYQVGFSGDVVPSWDTLSVFNLVSLPRQRMSATDSGATISADTRTSPSRNCTFAGCSGAPSRPCFERIARRTRPPTVDSGHSRGPTRTISLASHVSGNRSFPISTRQHGAPMTLACPSFCPCTTTIPRTTKRTPTRISTSSVRTFSSRRSVNR